jgi:hypothetical protein
MNIYALVGVLLALQFAAFGWRINREIPLGDAGRRTWFPIADFVNMAALISVVFFCVVWPIYIGSFTRISRIAIAVGFVLIAFHPVTMAAHYRLFSRNGRSIYIKKPGDDYPYATEQEIVALLISIGITIGTGYFIYLGGQ